MINCRGKIIDFNQPKIMGILNITPDSFFDGGRHNDVSLSLNHVEKMLSEGADIIDMGAASSRPNAKGVSEEEEMKRLLPVLISVRKEFPQALISVDTFRGGIAKAVIEEGADIINDIYAGSYDNMMVPVIQKYKVPYVVMHMQGTPDNMQDNPTYNNVVKDILLFFSEKINLLRSQGVADIIIDPGFGFGKTVTHNFEILKKLGYFTQLGLPVLIGISRKSLICKTLGVSPENALNGTTVLNTLALQKGASILRVHDVKEAVEARALILYMNNIN